MRASSVTTSLLLAAALAGCAGSDVPPGTSSDTVYVDLPQRQTTVSGIVYDPEVFFFSSKTFPSFPPPEGEEPFPPPPDALFDGTPYLTRAAALGAKVSVLDGDTVVSSSDPAAFNGSWQVTGVPTSDTIEYQVRAEPPAEGLVLGAPDIFSEPDYLPVPVAKYYPTTTLRPIVASTTSCQTQVATVAGEAGALGAVANLRTRSGTPTTPSSLVSGSGGVVLVWTYAPSMVLYFFTSPADGIAAETNQGTLYPIDWDLPSKQLPGQTAMGFVAKNPGGISSMGYYALVLPKGSTEPVSLTFTDTVTTPEGEEPGPGGPRPWLAPSFTGRVGPGVSVLRLHNESSMPPPPEDPYAEPTPPPDMSWLCMKW
ncbi:hypothetical protein [Archangium violaceum]|uniref:hypothetical protein n=1 Tax=Archangium violaceum TaxID=83451 RepID=UPI001EF64F4C|nr:hypothetical protein [Archangium violaceum]